MVVVSVLIYIVITAGCTMKIIGMLNSLVYCLQGTQYLAICYG